MSAGSVTLLLSPRWGQREAAGVPTGVLGPAGSVSPHRAGFAHQGAKEKQLLKEGNAFNVSSFVLRAMMSGQYWPEGDEVYHAELTVPVLLVHGMHDKFVPVEEDQRMAEVGSGLTPGAATSIYKMQGLQAWPLGGCGFPCGCGSPRGKASEVGVASWRAGVWEWAWPCLWVRSGNWHSWKLCKQKFLVGVALCRWGLCFWVYLCLLAPEEWEQ